MLIKVDFYVPGTTNFSGYTISSGVRQLELDRTIDLAVKSTDHPVSKWVHNQCAAGCQVNIQAGGDFYFDPRPADRPKDVLMVAGGVGINPLVSIFRHLADLQLHDSWRNLDGVHVGKIRLLYSAQTVEELVFKDEILQITSRLSNMTSSFYVTRGGEVAANDRDIKFGRLSMDDLRVSVSAFNRTDRLALICGPKAMLYSVESMLKQIGFQAPDIKYETWW